MMIEYFIQSYTFYSTYLTNTRTVEEIGVSFPMECDCYLGEIVLGGRDQRFGE